MALPASRLWTTAYGIVALPVFAVLLAITSVLALLVPGLALRRRLVRFFARLGLWVLGLRISVRGTEHLPDGSCVVVANHAS